jgi:C4-dicarboxylate transporter DctQ subunit
LRSKIILTIWDTLELYLAGILVCCSVGISFYQVVMRYVFKESPYWAEESVIYLVIWAIFIVASKLARDDEHVRVSFFVQSMSFKAQRVFQIVCCLLALVFCCLLAWYGFQIVAAALSFDERSVGRLMFPMWIVYLSIPVGGCLLVLSYVRRLYLLFFQFDPEKLLYKQEGE